MQRMIEFGNYRKSTGRAGLASICIPPVHHDRDLFVGLAEDGFEAVESADAAGEEPGAGGARWRSCPHRRDRRWRLHDPLRRGVITTLSRGCLCDGELLDFASGPIIPMI